MSSIVAGKTRLHVQSVELPGIVHNAMETVAPAANAKGVRVQTLIDPHASPSPPTPIVCNRSSGTFFQTR